MPDSEDKSETVGSEEKTLLGDCNARAQELLARARKLREKANSLENAKELNRLYQEVAELFEGKSGAGARPKSGLLSDLGTVFQIWTAIVDAVMEEGGNDESLRQVISNRELAKDIARLLTGKARVVEKT